MKEKYFKSCFRKRIGTKATILALFLVLAMTGMAVAQVNTANISGMKFNDLNHNGIKDPGEPGLANWAIRLPAPGQEFPRTTLTDSNGNYTFTGLAPGNYTVEEILQSGWIQTAPQGGTYNITLNGTDVTGVDFGNSKNHSVVILFVPNATESEKQEAIASVAGTITQEFTIINAVAATIPFGVSPDPIDELRENPLIVGIDVDKILSALDIDADIQVHADQVWSLGFTGSGVRLAILDSGIERTNPEFAGRIVACHTEVPGTTTCEDDFGHGTHVAGIAGAQGVNHTLIGVAPSVLLMIDKVLNKSGQGTEAQEIAGIQWAVNNNADIISLSIGDYTGEKANLNCDAKSVVEKAAIDAAISKGITVVAAAGNNGPLGVGSPACISSTIAVGSVDNNNNLYLPGDIFHGSSVGAPMRDHGVVAPGAHINSIWRGVPTRSSGTSMAAPMVSGSIALMLSKNPNLTPAEIKNILFNTADCVPQNNVPVMCPNDNIGWGVENESAAVDAVKLVNGSISGTKFNDINGNGNRDPEDSGLQGWTITLKMPDGTSTSSVTDSSGHYTFGGLAAGTYTIGEVLQPSWKQTAPAGGTYTVTLSSGENVTDKDFGNFQPGSISGMKFNDLNGNGINDAEPGLDGWTITLTGPSGTKSTVTSGGGNYMFDGLVAGTYTIGEVLQPGWKQTAPTTGTYSVTITSGAVITGKDLGNKKYSIYGMKFNDKNGNGKRDVGEEGLAGWRIRLIGVDTLTMTPVNREEITDANGNYEFMDVRPGIYQVFEVIDVSKAGWVPTTPPTVPITNLKAIEGINVNFGNKKIP